MHRLFIRARPWPTLSLTRWLSVLAVLATLAASMGTSPAHAASPHKALFVGNSYTFYNAPSELKACYKALMTELGTTGGVEVHGVTAGGYKLVQHAADAKQGGTELNQALAKPWQVVVLQEQSQIPAFKAAGSPMYAQSLQAFVALDDLAEKSGAVTIALMTWGRRDGDKQNAWLSPFKTMQKHLAAGYAHYAKQASTPTRQVYVAPAGFAFQKIHDDIVSAGGKPLAAGSDFVALYDGDGSHPSPQGSYLAALTVVRTVTGADLTKLSWAPPGMAKSVAQKLRAAAQSVVQDGPWKGATGSPDAGGTDGGGSDGGSATEDAGSTDADTGTSDVGVIEDTSADDAGTGSDTDMAVGSDAAANAGDAGSGADSEPDVADEAGPVGGKKQASSGCSVAAWGTATEESTGWPLFALLSATLWLIVRRRDAY
ncbi:MAG: hypothetical protein KC502_09870 [Myxococcales bacterium]|nr:hypothetical protein [Myxococcales bacterium]